MAYNFKKLSDVALQEVTTENTNIYIEENGETKKIAASNLGGGVSSWNDLTDRPFGVGTAIVYDRAVFDGNTEGHATLDIDGTLYVKIHDIVPTINDCTNGVTITATNNGVRESIVFPYEEIYEMYSELGFIMLEYAFVIPSDNFDLMDMVTVPEAGIYVVHLPDYGVFVNEVVFDGYTGFPATEVEVINHIDTNYIPDSIARVEDVIDSAYEYLYIDKGVTTIQDIQKVINDDKNRGKILILTFNDGIDTVRVYKIGGNNFLDDDTTNYEFYSPILFNTMNGGTSNRSLWRVHLTFVDGVVDSISYNWSTDVIIMGNDGLFYKICVINGEVTATQVT